MVDRADRALILVPNQKRTEKYTDLFKALPCYTAQDIETSKDAFVSETKAIATLANRYDGIDMLNEECRLLVIDGLPKAGNLQEMYLMTRMVAGNLFKDRIRTRMIQAFGRCTRSATDYAAVVVIGEDFYDSLVLQENRSLFHPELQGELMFGTDQSENMTHKEFIENLEIFLEHDTNWDDADKDILLYRDDAKQLSIKSEDKLFEAAQKEVNYLYALWNKDYEQCVNLAQHVTSLLPGDDLKGLRGFWNYLAASSAELAYHQIEDKSFLVKSQDLYQRASSCLSSLSWLRVLAANKNLASKIPIAPEPDFLLDSNIEKIEILFEHQSFSLPHKFEKVVKKMLEDLNSKDADTFEEAHRFLGELLGFDAKNSSGHATPDPWWISNGTTCLVAEDKSDSNPDHEISVRHTRQAVSHPKWIKDNLAITTDVEIHTVMISTQKKIHKDVPTYAENVGYWHIDDFREWANGAINVLRTLRNTYSGPGQEEWRARVRRHLLENNLDPASIIKTATQTLLKDVEKA